MPDPTPAPPPATGVAPADPAGKLTPAELGCVCAAVLPHLAWLAAHPPPEPRTAEEAAWRRAD